MGAGGVPPQLMSALLAAQNAQPMQSQGGQPPQMTPGSQQNAQSPQSGNALPPQPGQGSAPGSGMAGANNWLLQLLGSALGHQQPTGPNSGTIPRAGSASSVPQFMTDPRYGYLAQLNMNNPNLSATQQMNSPLAAMGGMTPPTQVGGQWAPPPTTPPPTTPPPTTTPSGTTVSVPPGGTLPVVGGGIGGPGQPGGPKITAAPAPATAPAPPAPARTLSPFDAGYSGPATWQ